MRFTVQLDEKKFASLMRGRSDFLDVLVEERQATFLAYDLGVTVSCCVPIITSEDYEDVYFRVPAKVFLSFLTEGLVEFTLTGSEVIFKFLFKESTEQYQFEVKRQIVNFERFEKIKLLRDHVLSGNYPKIDLMELESFIKLAYSIGSVVSSDGSVFYCATNNVQLYCETRFPSSQSLSIYAGDLYALMRHDNCVYNIGSSVVSMADEFLVGVDKVRQTMTSDYAFLVKKTSKKKFVANLTNALAAVKRLNYWLVSAEINFTQKVCRLEAENCKMSVPITVGSVKSDKATRTAEDVFKALEEKPDEVRIFLTKTQSGLLYGIKQHAHFDIFSRCVKVTLSPRMFLVISRSD